jgi:GDP-D-mannose 3',5'-epimerase
MSQRRAVVAGAGGFIGHHMVNYLKDKGYWVRGVDVKEAEYEPTAADEFLLLDLREYDNCLQATSDVAEVYQLAADMGGIGYITANHAEVARNNVLINATAGRSSTRRSCASTTPRKARSILG